MNNPKNASEGERKVHVGHKKATSPEDRFGTPPPPVWSIPPSMDIPISLIEKYRHSFNSRNEQEGSSWVGGQHILHTIQLDATVCRYFNTDLVRAMALADWASKNCSDDSQVFYLLEDAINRQCACWEYLFQNLVHVVGFEQHTMPSRISRDEMLGMAAYDMEFLPQGDMYTINYRERDYKEAAAIIRKRRQQLGYLQTGSRAEQFFKEVDQRYARGSWLDDVKLLFRDHPVKKVREWRNSILHNYPLGSLHRITGEGGTFPGNHFSGSPTPEVPATLVLKNLTQAHARLKKAIVLTRRAAFANNLPNSAATAGVQYYAERKTCPHCDQSTNIPIPDPGMEAFDKFYCQNCGLWSPGDVVQIVETIQAPEHVYASLLRERLIDVARGLKQLVDDN